MKTVRIVMALLCGAGIGSGAMWAWMVFGPSTYPSVSPGEVRAEDDHRDYSSAHTMPTKQIASRLLARAGRSFVADTRYGDMPIDWVGFYTQPKPYGETLCSVDFVKVPRKVVRGRIENEGEFWEDDISVEQQYFIWKLPGVDPKLTREDACTHYHDLPGGLIYAKETLDRIALERQVNVLSAAVAKAKAGKVDFKITCRDARDSDHPKSCDGMALLTHVNWQNVYQVSQKDTAKTEGSERHMDWVYMRHGRNPGCMRSQDVRFEIVSTQVYGRHAIWEGDLQEINIVWAANC